MTLRKPSRSRYMHEGYWQQENAVAPSSGAAWNHLYRAARLSHDLEEA
jgi:hypothetical protein